MTMKKIFLCLLFITSLCFVKAQTLTPRTGVSTASLQAITVNSINAVFKDGSGNTAISRLNDIYTTEYASTGHLSNIYYNGVIGATQKIDTLNSLTRRLNALMVYNNNKQDSMLTATQSTELTFTVNSANTATAVTANQVIGVGIYSVTIPTGRWVIQSIHCIFKLQSATTTMRMYMMQGSSNASAYAEEATINLSSANALEISQVYVTNTTNYTTIIWNGSTGAVSHFNVAAQPSVFNEQHIYNSGTLKLALTYGGSLTPANANSYYFRIYLRRIS